MKVLKLFFGLGISLFLIFGIWASAYALDIRTKQSLDVKSTDQIEDEILAAAGEIKIAGSVNNDFIGAGSSVDISGKINGDLNVAGGTIYLKGEVSEDARIIGGTVKIDGTVKKNLILLGGSIDISETAVIEGDVVVYGGTLKHYGTIKTDLRYSGGSVLIAGTIEGNARLNSPEITIASSAHIVKDLDYTSTNAATIQNGAKIDGQSTYKLSQKQDIFANKSASSMVISGLAFILLAIIFVYFLPNRIKGIADVLRTTPGPAALSGIIGLIFIPIIVLVLLITVIGAPTAAILLVLYLLSIYLAKIFVASIIGNLVLKLAEKKKEPSMLWSVVTGLILVLIAINIPYVGYVISLIINILGLGAIVLYLYNLRKAARAFKLV